MKHRKKKPMNIIEILSKDELKRLFMAIDKPNVMIATLLGYFAGLRISEACKLRKADFELDRDRPSIKIRESKFGRSRIVPIIIPKLIPLIKKYFDALNHFDKELSNGQSTETVYEISIRYESTNPRLDFTEQPTLKEVKGRSMDFKILYK